MEVGATLQKVRKQLRDVGARVEDLNRSAQAADAEDGVSLLQLKACTLLRYAGNLSAYCAARTRGEALPDVLRAALCEDWAALDVARPLERKLRPQLKALLEAPAAAAVRGGAAEVQHRPNPAAMVGASDSDSDASEDAGDKQEAYVPPRFAEVVHDASADAAAKARAEARRARMRRGAGAKAMLAELRGLPEELRTAGNEMQISGEEKARVRYEEDNFVRLAQRKKQRHADAKRRRAAEQGDGDGDGLGSLAALADNVVGKRKKAAAGAGRAPQDETGAKVRALDAADASASSRGRGRARGRKRRRKE